MNAPRGWLFVMVGPGGTGKNTLMNMILERHENIQQLATATTRPIRPDEQEGREHIFVDTEEFNRMIRDDELLEYQEVTPGRFYGIIEAKVENALAAGRYLIADIDVYGARVLRETYPDDTVLFFVTVPGETVEDQLRLLRARMTARFRTRELSKEQQDLIQQRLDRARTLELPFAASCDHIIVNDNKDRSIHDLEAIIVEKMNERPVAKENQ